MTTTSPTTRLPVTVVTGFLGAGKTTLLRHLLLNSGLRLAVVVNEFGEVGIDGDLIAACGFCTEEDRQNRLVELANGCLCCTVQDEFLPTMEMLLERAGSLDGILVETSGLALPEPLVAAFGWPEIRRRTRVHGVVTVVDGEALAAGHVVGDREAVEAQRRADPSLDHLTAIEELFEEQLEAADLVLLSRADRIPPGRLDEVRRNLEPLLRKGTPVLTMERGAVDPCLLLDAGRPLRPGASTSSAPWHGEHDGHGHDHGHVAMASLTLRREGTLSRGLVEAELSGFLASYPVLRLKGHLREPGKRLLLQIQAVGRRLECWYEGEAAAMDPEAMALELVLLAAAADAARLEEAVGSLLSPEG